MRLSIFIVLLTAGCSRPSPEIITVNGSIPSEKMELSLIHEHLLVDFVGADSTGYHRWNRDTVIARVLPYLLEAKSKGVKTFVDCTPAYLGRDPLLLKLLSEKSGIQIITNTGYYGAVDNKYLPAHAFTETANELAQRWISEFNEGIEGSGVKPGFMKISVGAEVPLSDLHQKLVRAAAIAHLSTGLTIASHTGPALPALEEIAILQQEGVDPSAFIWVHAQAEKDYSYYDRIYNLGAWISLDGAAWDVEGHLDRLLYCKEKGLLDKVLLSHDAGWYKPGEPGGGDFKGFTAIFDELIPKLIENGYTQNEVDRLLVVNPSNAFTVAVRRK